MQDKTIDEMKQELAAASRTGRFSFKHLFFNSGISDTRNLKSSLRRNIISNLEEGSVLWSLLTNANTMGMVGTKYVELELSIDGNDGLLQVKLSSIYDWVQFTVDEGTDADTSSDTIVAIPDNIIEDIYNEHSLYIAAPAAAGPAQVDLVDEALGDDYVEEVDFQDGGYIEIVPDSKDLLKVLVNDLREMAGDQSDYSNIVKGYADLFKPDNPPEYVEEMEKSLEAIITMVKEVPEESKKAFAENILKHMGNRVNLVVPEKQPSIRHLEQRVGWGKDDLARFSSNVAAAGPARDAAPNKKQEIVDYTGNIKNLFFSQRRAGEFTTNFKRIGSIPDYDEFATHLMKIKDDNSPEIVTFLKGDDSSSLRLLIGNTAVAVPDGLIDKIHNQIKINEAVDAASRSGSSAR